MHCFVWCCHALLRDYIWIDGIPIANVDTSGATSTVSYVIADQLGTPRAVVDSNRNTLWQWAYQGNPWGEAAPTSSNYLYNLRFAGQYADAESGLFIMVIGTSVPGVGVIHKVI